jgi:ubiquinone/menaquinone biosynthesis C-methylase UbiE
MNKENINFESVNLSNKRLESWQDRSDFILNNLGLSIEDLKNKKTLDIGAGERYIAAVCAKKGISNDVYSLEPNIDDTKFVRNLIKEDLPEVSAGIDGKTIQGNRESLPFDDERFDLIINSCALPGKKFLKEGNIDEMKKNIDITIEEMIRVLKPGGEARIYPLEFYPDGQEEKYKPWKEAVENKLRDIESNKQYQVMFEKHKPSNRKTYATRIVITKKKN